MLLSVLEILEKELADKKLKDGKYPRSTPLLIACSDAAKKLAEQKQLEEKKKGEYLSFIRLNNSIPEELAKQKEIADKKGKYSNFN